MQDDMATKPFRVVFLDHSAQPGGGQLGMLRYFEQESEFQRIAVFATGGSVADKIREQGIETHVIDPSLDTTRKRIARLTFSILRELRRISPDAVVLTSGTMVKLMPLIRWMKIPIITYAREGLVHESRGNLKSRAVAAFFHPGMKGYIANSEWTLSTIPRWLHKGRAHVSYPISGVTEALTNIRTRTFPNSSEIRIATFSRPVPWKGLHLAVSALQSIAEANPEIRMRLDIYGGNFFGQNQYVSELTTQLQSSNFPYKVHGHVEDVAAKMRGTDIVILPSLIPEPFGQVVSQGLAAGAIVIISDHGGAAEQVQDGISGYKFSPGSVESLQSVILRTINNPEQSQIMQLNARKESLRFTDAVLAINFDKAISEIILGRNSGGQTK